MRGDRARLWQEDVEHAERTIDKIDIGDGSGGFIEPSTRVYVGTVMWADRVITTARAFAEAYREEPLGRVAAARYSALVKALEIDDVTAERGSSK